MPTDYAQVLPVPHVDSTDVSRRTPQRLITLTTCHPQFSDAERMIIHGVLVRSYAKSPGFLPPELGGGLSVYTWIWRHLPGPTAARTGAGAAAVPARRGAAVLRGLPVAGAVPAVRPGHPGLSRRPSVRGTTANAVSGAPRCATLVGVTTILVVDNYDSFVFNLVQYLEQLGADCIVRRNDEVTTDEVADLGSTACCCHPVPGPPRTPA